MATADPLVLDTYHWSTIDGIEVTESTGYDDISQNANHDAKKDGMSRQESKSTGKTETFNESPRTKPVALTMKEEARLARRASRKQRPSRSRSLLDEMAADKALKNGTPSTLADESNNPVSTPIEASTSQRYASKLSLGLSDERRHSIQTSLHEQVEGQAVLQDNSTTVSTSPASTASTMNTRVSFEGIEAFDTNGTIASPIAIPSVSAISSFPSPRPTPGVRIQSSAPKRRLSRRRSTRTNASSSYSPASAFLARWNCDETTSAPDPDEEGQEIGGNSGYIIGRQIGYGGFSIVKEAHTIEGGEKVLRAVKIVRKTPAQTVKNRNERAQQEFEHEITIWRYLKHKRILPLLAVFDTEFATFCIMQISSGGSLFDVVAQYRRKSSESSISSLSGSLTAHSLSSPESRHTMPLTHAKHYMAQIASALHYLHHDVRIVHRDIKLENCLIIPTSESDSRHMKRAATTPISSIEPLPDLPDSVSDDIKTAPPPGNILICDFGMADFIAQEDRDDQLAATNLKCATEVDESQLLEGMETNEPPPLKLNTQNLGPGPNSATFSSGPSTASSNDANDAPPPTDPATIIAGSLPYAAPELFKSSIPLYSAAADMWAFGVLSYALLVGELPFKHGLQSTVVGMIEEGAWDVRSLKSAVGPSYASDRGPDYGRKVEHAVECVEGCLRLDVDTRWNVGRVVQSQFLQGFRDHDGFAVQEAGGI